jgi:hypothetical protein
MNNEDKKKLTKTYIAAINDLDIRSEVAAKIIDLLMDSQLDEDQAANPTDELFKEFIEISLQILAIATVKFIKGIPFDKQSLIELAEAFGKTIVMNLDLKIEDNE